MSGVEIERKFLVSGKLEDIIADAEDYEFSYVIEQAYLGGTGDWAVRVRRQLDDGGKPLYHFMTLKKKITDVTSVELEEMVSPAFYHEALQHAGPVLRKHRHYFMVQGEYEFSIDVFLNPELDGLMLAEIELENENDFVAIPQWALREVTHDPQYRNFNLAKRLA
jgi:adenylate cyclase